MRMHENVAHMGLDHHKNFGCISARDTGGRVVRRERLDYFDRTELRQKLACYPPGTPVVLEGTFGWGWISDELSAAGLRPHLANSSKVAAWRKTRGGAKSNRVDGDALSELPGEKTRWWEVWLAPPDVRDHRQWLRHRMALVQTQTAVKNRVHALLQRHGLSGRDSDLFGTGGRRWLSLLLGQPDAPLGEAGREILKALLAELDAIRRLIAQANRRIATTLQGHPAARRLMTLPGVGRILAYTIIAEVGRIERFRRASGLTAYSLLAPLADDSGDEHPDQPPVGRHVGHAGRRTLKWAFIEAAHGAVKKDARMRAIFDRRTDGGKRDRNRGRIAVAHELCRLSHVLWSRGQDYDPAGRIRPGSRPRTDAAKDTDTGSVPGQPDQAMAPGGKPARRPQK